jgi:hypothetical protein
MEGDTTLANSLADSSIPESKNEDKFLRSLLETAQMQPGDVERSRLGPRCDVAMLRAPSLPSGDSWTGTPPDTQITHLPYSLEEENDATHLDHLGGSFSSPSRHLGRFALFLYL